jgi:hypothetical protein
MGGSGGGFFTGDVSGDELARRTREAEQKAQDEQFELEVSAFLAEQLSDYSSRDTAATQTVFDSVKEDLQSDFGGTIDLLFGGSIAKHTDIDGLSDVDALVLLDRSDVADNTPSQLRGLLADRLRARFGRDSVFEGILAVTLKVQNQTIQLLPALRDGKKFKIASSDGQRWSTIDPVGFAQALTKTNQAKGGKVVPCIKIAKAIIYNLPEQRRLTGYHIESLAIKIFRAYFGPKTWKAMVYQFFERASEYVRNPITDSTGQSVHVDEYLGEANSVRRRILADTLDRMARRIRNANGAHSLEAWKELLGD